MLKTIVDQVNYTWKLQNIKESYPTIKLRFPNPWFPYRTVLNSEYVEADIGCLGP